MSVIVFIYILGGRLVNNKIGKNLSLLAQYSNSKKINLLINGVLIFVQFGATEECKRNHLFVYAYWDFSLIAINPFRYESFQWLFAFHYAGKFYPCTASDMVMSTLCKDAALTKRSLKQRVTDVPRANFSFWKSPRVMNVRAYENKMTCFCSRGPTCNNLISDRRAKPDPHIKSDAGDVSDLLLHALGDARWLIHCRQGIL